MIFKRRPAPLSAAVRVFALISISSIAFGIDITIDYDEYLALMQQQLAERNGMPYIPGASGPHDYEEAVSRLDDDYPKYSDEEDDSTIVVDPDNMYDDDGNVIDISKYERVKESDKIGGGGGCNLGCRNAGGGDDEDEEETTGMLGGLVSALPSLPSFGGGSDGEDGAVGDLTPIIVVSVLVIGGLLLCSGFLYVLDVYATTALDRYLLVHYGPELYERYTSEYDADGNGFEIPIKRIESGGGDDGSISIGGGGSYGPPTSLFPPSPPVANATPGHSSAAAGGEQSLMQQLSSQFLRHRTNFYNRRGFPVQDKVARIWQMISSAWEKYSA